MTKRQGNQLFLVSAAALILSMPVLEAASVSALEGLSPAEEAKLKSCEEGIAGLNPKIASDCLGQKHIFQQLSAHDPARAIKLLRDAHTLKDLADLVDLHTNEIELRTALLIRLTKNSPAAELGLAKPEKFCNWVLRWQSEKYTLSQTAVLDWYLLPGEQRIYFGTLGYSFKEWSALSLENRNAAFEEFVKAETIELSKTPYPLDWLTLKNFADRFNRITKTIYDDELRNHILQLNTLYTLQYNAAETLKNNPAALKKYRKELQNIKELGASEQLSRLNTLFDNNAAAGDFNKTVINSQKTASGEELTDEDETASDEELADEDEMESDEELTDENIKIISALLPSALMQAIAGTFSGDKIADSLKNKTPTVGFETMGEAFAQYHFDTGIITFNNNLIQEWLTANSHTIEDLRTKEEPIKKLALYLSPVFIHEATHKEEHNWARTKDIVKIIDTDDEVEAASAEALYTIEKMKKDAKFAAMFPQSEVSTYYINRQHLFAKLLIENPREFRRTVKAEYYPNLPSFNTSASLFLTLADQASDELQRRKSLPKETLDRLEMGSGSTINTNFIKNTINGKPSREVIPLLTTRGLEKFMAYCLRCYSSFNERREKSIESSDKALGDIMLGKTDEPETASIAVPPPLKQAKR